MTACIFIGPTVAADAVGADVVCLPPAAQGDVVRAVRRHAPTAIGIVDGLFGGAPAVWHKEILWALGEGVAVFGSASMGALRAAELHSFGMRGVGRIFEAYRDGVLEDEDEVALIHGPAALGYPALSEPMVNIRATLTRAEREAALDAPACVALAAFAKSRHFPERTWTGVLDGCGLLDPEARRRFEAWLEVSRVDQKRDDALAMVAAMDAPAPATAAPYRFAATHHWNALLARIDHEAEELDKRAERVLEELRLGAQPLLQAMRTRALLRRSVLDGGPAPARTPDHASVALRTTLGLLSREQFEAWLTANELGAAAFAALAERSLRVRVFEGGAAERLAADLIDELRLSGDYAVLAARADAKAALLARHAVSGPPTPATRMGLRHWFAAFRLGGTDVALPALLEATGFADADALDRALHRERLYLTLAAPAPEG